MENQFIPESDFVARFSIAQKNVLSAAQVKTILDAELFTAYEQKELNIKYLKQATKVRKYTTSKVAGLSK